MMRPPSRTVFTARSTALVISGIAEATAPATRASSALIIRRIRSVGKRSISTDRGLRLSVLMSLTQTNLSVVVVQRHLIGLQKIMTEDAGDFSLNHFRNLA